MKILFLLSLPRYHFFQCFVERNLLESPRQHNSKVYLRSPLPLLPVLLGLPHFRFSLLRHSMKNFLPLSRLALSDLAFPLPGLDLFLLLDQPPQTHSVSFSTMSSASDSSLAGSCLSSSSSSLSDSFLDFSDSEEDDEYDLLSSFSESAFDSSMSAVASAFSDTSSFTFSSMSSASDSTLAGSCLSSSDFSDSEEDEEEDEVTDDLSSRSSVVSFSGL